MDAAHPFFDHSTSYGAPPRFGAEPEVRAPVADNARALGVLAASVVLVAMTLSIKVQRR